jgi:S-adenosylmethionine hydrolase
MNSSLITLLTDFGTADGFVGAMKGVIFSLNPSATVVDITHDIASQDIMGGALALAAAVPFFPEGSIHVAVVDPGVGTARKPILVTWRSRYLIGPDNGLLSLVFPETEPATVYHLEDRSKFLANVSCTFHGRDVFAPAAARLSAGAKPEDFGPRLEQWERLRIPRPVFEKERISGQVIHVDRFGNLITNVREEDLPLGRHRKQLKIRLAGRVITGVLTSYAEVEPGETLAVIGSGGFLELSQNRGNASSFLGVSAGACFAVDLNGL